MKKSILFLALSLMFVGKSNAQWLVGGNTLGGAGIFGSTNLEPIQFQTNGINTGWMDETNQRTGIGAGWGSLNRPNYQLDILGGSAGDGVNVSYSTTNNVGYHIGDSMVLWHNGIITSIFVGAYAGGTSPAGANNTFVGNLSGYHNTAAGNTFIGFAAAYANTTGILNTAVGTDALYANTMISGNVAVGDSALYSHTFTSTFTSGNVAVGSSALFSNQPTGITNGYENTALGHWAMRYNTIGSRNTSTGFASLYANIAATDNTANGYEALMNNTNAGQNTAVGSQAMYTQNAYHGDTVWVTENTAVGYQALYSNNPTYGAAGNGNRNTAEGVFSLYSNTIGFSNVAIGADALQDNTTGWGNIAIGVSALAHGTTASTFNTNIAVGGSALQECTGGGNVAVGTSALGNATTGSSNVAIGGIAMGNGKVSGEYNTAVGAQTLYDVTSGYKNTALGTTAMILDTTGALNVAIGYGSLSENLISYYNVAVGVYALNFTTVGPNTATGYEAGYNITTGTYNSADGYYSMYGATGCTGKYNDASGAYSLFSLSSADSDVAHGPYSLYNLTSGNANAALGYRAGFSVTTDTDNLFLGARADRGSSAIRNAAAIGYHTITTTTNQFEIGANNVSVTMGMSNQALTNPTRLELNTANGPAPFNVGATGTPPAYVNGGVGKGWSGLRFDDLTTASTPVKNPGAGYLSVDNSGNVIYVDTSFAPNSNHVGFGYCSPGPLTNMTGDAGINLGTSNLYFEGTSASNPALTDVIIGNNCGYIPQAKLDVWQQSASYTGGSIGIRVENDDTGTCSNPVIGLKSIVNGPVTSIDYTRIAGYFDAPPNPNCTGSLPQCAIFVPQNGGTTLLGYPATFPLPTGPQLYVYGYFYGYGNNFVNLAPSSGWVTFKSYAEQPLSLSKAEIAVEGVANSNTSSGYPNVGVVAVANGTTLGVPNIGLYAAGHVRRTDYAAFFNGNVWIQNSVHSSNGYLSVSDSVLKTNVNSFSNAIAIIQKLKPRTYYFDTINSYNIPFDTFMHYGFIAQQVQRAVPPLTRSVLVPPQVDTDGTIISSTVPNISLIDYTQVIPILTAAFQERESILYNDSIKQKQTNDSLRYTLDSLRAAFKSYASCLASLCTGGDGHKAIHRTGSDSNTGNNNATNIQDVSLSSLTNAPLLYQNTPNPFSTGTKINYYLPQGTQGAMIVFYDNYGNQIKTVQLSQTGNGTLNITPDNLSNGIYSYSLIVNNNVIDTKRMVLQK